MRFYIVGTSGTGKSTLAKAISHKLKIPHIELDFYRFDKNWQKHPADRLHKIITQKTKSKSWVVCGNESGKLKDHLMDQATQIIWLDYPFYLIFYRVFIRTMRRIFLKEKSCGGNQETFYLQFFTKYSIFLWVIQTYSKRKRQYTPMLSASEFKKKMVHLKSSSDADLFLKKL